MAHFALKLKKKEIFFKTCWNIKNNSCIFALAFENYSRIYKEQIQ